MVRYHIPVDLNNIDWDALMTHGQQGSGPFVGMPRQRGGMRGRGIGGILASLLSMIPTFLGSTVGKEILNVGKDVISDIAHGNKVVDSIKTNGRQAVKNLTGLGIKRPIGILKPHKLKSLKRKRSVLLNGQDA